MSTLRKPTRTIIKVASNSARNDIGQRVELNSYFGCALRHARYATVHRVARKRQADGNSRGVKPICRVAYLLRTTDAEQTESTHRRHQGIEPGQYVHRGEERRHQVHALLQTLVS